VEELLNAAWPQFRSRRSILVSGGHDIGMKTREQQARDSGVLHPLMAGHYLAMTPKKLGSRCCKEFGNYLLSWTIINSRNYQLRVIM